MSETERTDEVRENCDFPLSQIKAPKVLNLHFNKVPCYHDEDRFGGQEVEGGKREDGLSQGKGWGRGEKLSESGYSLTRLADQIGGQA